MILRLKALRSLRWNYTWRGVWDWCRARRFCLRCKRQGIVFDRELWERVPCPCCHGKRPRGYQRVLTEPEQVLAEQDQLASGAYV